MVKSTHVPSQYLGYSIQTTRMVCLLLDAPEGSAVCLEVFEDVGVIYEDGSQLAQQVKSTTSSHNPISDFSIELWKTFSNWIDSVEKGEISIDNAMFEIYVSKPKDGKFAKKLSSAKDIESVEEVLKEISQTFEERKKDFSKEIINCVEKVINQNRPIAQKIFESFSLIEGTGDINSELVALLAKNKAIPDDIVDDVGRYLLGWVKQKTDAYIQNNKPAIIQDLDFRGELQATIRKLDRGNILQSFAPNPEEREIEAEKIKTYVLQLGIIDEDENTKLQAINDYLKAAINRAEWAKKGLVSYSSFTDFETSLKKTWNNSKTKITITYKELSDVDKGKLLFAECSGHTIALQGQSIPDSFVAGSFHTLADVLEIGWHPLYEDLLSKQIVKEPT
jgi:hypothetical protein